MSDEELDRLKELCDNADKGPWEITPDTSKGMDEAWCQWHRVGPYDLMGELPDDNDLFIQAAREAMPLLVEELKVLKGLISDGMQDSGLSRMALEKGRKEGVLEGLRLAEKTLSGLMAWQTLGKGARGSIKALIKEHEA